MSRSSNCPAAPSPELLERSALDGGRVKGFKPHADRLSRVSRLARNLHHRGQAEWVLRLAAIPSMTRPPTGLGSGASADSRLISRVVVSTHALLPRVDGGGTKTAACLLDGSRRELGRGRAGPWTSPLAPSIGHPRFGPHSHPPSPRFVRAPPRHTLESVCAGVAGYTAKPRRSEFTVLSRNPSPRIATASEPDFVIAWWGATEGKPGIIVSAGTGAVVYGAMEAGESYREDGVGFLLGDLGSGF